MLYFCSDGGGTKLQMLAFDDQLRLLAHVKGPAITSYYIPWQQVRQGVEDTLLRLLAALPPDLPTDSDGHVIIDRLYQTTCGGCTPQELLPTMATLRETVHINEGPCGLLAGAAARSGVLTLAGTGSDCFYVQDCRMVDAVGGFGPVLGDEGSGYDLGRQALVAAIHADQDRGPDTLLRQYVFEDYGLKERLFELDRKSVV